MEAKELLKEICNGCGGCSVFPRDITDLCSNPLEKYLYRKAEISFKAGMVQGKMDYLLGQSELIIEAKQAGKQEGVKKVVEQVNLLARSLIAGQDIATVAGNELAGDTSYLLLPLLEWQAKLKKWGITCP